MAIAMAAGVISCLVSSWMISHFGIKPVSGGRPARDKSTNIRAVCAFAELYVEFLPFLLFNKQV